MLFSIIASALIGAHALAPGGTYVVRPGDTLAGVGAKTGYSAWYQIYELNVARIGHDPNMLRPGTVLRLPSSHDQSDGLSSSEDLVVVTPGATLSSIAQRTGTSVATLYALNRDVIGPNPNVLHPGETLRLR